MEVDIEDILNEEFTEKDILDRIKKDKLPSMDLPDKIDSKDAGDIKLDAPKDISDLCGRLKGWHENCRDLLVDLRTINYEITEDDTYVEFKDNNYYGQKIYFKVDLQNPKDAKVIHATKQLCKIIGIPYAFFAANRPSLKKNIVRT
jgi:hypothetical protein